MIGQDRPGGPAARLQHQHGQQGTHDDVHHAQRALPVEERVEPAARVADPERQHRVERHEQGHRGEQPVEDTGVVAPPALVRAPAAGAVADEDERQDRGEEEDQVELVAALERCEDLPQHEHRGQEAQRDHDAVEPGGEPPGRAFLVVLGDELVGGLRGGEQPGGRVRHRVAVSSCGIPAGRIVPWTGGIRRVVGPHAGRVRRKTPSPRVMILRGRAALTVPERGPSVGMTIADLRRLPRADLRL